VRNGVTAGDGRTRLVLGVVLSIVMFGVAIAAVAGPLRNVVDFGAPPPQPVPIPTSLVPSSEAPGENGGQEGFSGLPTMSVAELPSEGRRTLVLIEEGGPFPFERDGAVFANREGLLPKQVDGYYHEYTVATPGAANQSPRRIVIGEAGERYYTSDHYSSFREVLR